MHLEPHVPRGLPGVDVGAVGHAGHVELDGAEVRDLVHGGEAELVARRDGGRAGAGAHLLAAHIGAHDVRDAVVALVPLGLAHVGPFFGVGRAGDDELWEAVFREEGELALSADLRMFADLLRVELTVGLDSRSRQQQGREELHRGCRVYRNNRSWIKITSR